MKLSHSRLTHHFCMLHVLPHASRSLRSLVATQSAHRRLVTLSAMVAPKEQPTFWYSTGCPFAHRAWLALTEKGIEYTPKVIDLSDKPKEFEELYHTVNTDPKSSAKVPILIDHGATIIESALVVEYLDKAYPDTGTKLYPDDPAAAFKVKLFIETFNEQMSAFPLLRASTKAQLEERKEKFIAGLKVMDEFLQRHGSTEGGSYFLGGTYSAAETITTPMLRRGLVALPALRDFDVMAVIKAEKLERLEAWIHASLERPSNKSTGPASDQDIIDGWKKFTVPLED